MPSESLLEPLKEMRTADLPGEILYRIRLSAAGGTVQWEPPTVEEVAALLPSFEIVAFLGRGGMGAVYKGRQVKLDRLVAIKLLPPEISADEDFRRRFTREARTMGRFMHPRIATIYDLGETKENHLFYTMEFVDGTSLHDAIALRNLTALEAGRIICEVCEGLACCHEHGVVHRDVKPANVLIDRKGHAKLADFGIARWQTPGTDPVKQTAGNVFGTRDYVSPEQLNGEEGDHRSDIYALGVMLYEALCGEIPRGQFDAPSRRAGTDPRFDPIVAKAMQSAPERRYASAQEMLRALQEVSAEPPSSGPGVPPGRGTSRWAAWQAVAAALAMAALVSALSWALLASVKETAGLKQPGAPSITAATGKLPVPEAWHDWLGELKGLPAGLSETEAGYAFTPPAGTSGVQLACGPALHDQALRVTYRVVPEMRPRPAIRIGVRCSASAASGYGVNAGGKAWELIRQESAGETAILASAPKPSGMTDGAIRVLELRALGNDLTFSYNGTVRAIAQDAKWPAGTPAVYGTKGVILLKVEWLDLSR